MRAVAALAIVVAMVQAAHALATEPSPSSPSSAQEAPSEDGRVDINTASAEALAELPGIGPTRARAIIQAREKRRFRRVEEILRVPGIGRKTFARIRHSIRVE